jgi:hypothetical protein
VEANARRTDASSCERSTRATGQTAREPYRFCAPTYTTWGREILVMPVLHAPRCVLASCWSYWGFNEHRYGSHARCSSGDTTAGWALMRDGDDTPGNTPGWTHAMQGYVAPPITFQKALSVITKASRCLWTGYVPDIAS